MWCGLAGLFGNFFISAKHERQYGHVIANVQQCIACQAVGMEHHEVNHQSGIRLLGANV